MDPTHTFHHLIRNPRVSGDFSLADLTAFTTGPPLLQRRRKFCIGLFRTQSQSLQVLRLHLSAVHKD